MGHGPVSMPSAPRYKGCESAGDANKLNRPRNGFIESHSELLTGNKESAANIPWDRMSIRSMVRRVHC